MCVCIYAALPRTSAPQERRGERADCENYSGPGPCAVNGPRSREWAAEPGPRSRSVYCTRIASLYLMVELTGRGPEGFGPCIGAPSLAGAGRGPGRVEGARPRVPAGLRVAEWFWTRMVV